jgi:hypothetical protein
MLRFGSDESPRRRRRVPMPARLPNLIVMLVVVVGLMVYTTARATRLVEQEQPAHEAPVVSESTDEAVATDLSSPSDVRAVELTRLADFVDHSLELDPDPYFYLLDLARHNPTDWLEKNARRDVTVAHLLRDPEKYRGQVIALRGRLRRLIRDEFDDNEYGFQTRYEGCVYTDEGGRTPYIVIVAEPPTGLPLGDIFEHITVAGYFLGWWRHDTQEGKRYSSPVLLARRFRWQAPPALRPDAEWTNSYGLAVGIAIAVLSVAAAVVVMRRARPTPVRAVNSDAEPLFFEGPPTQNEDGASPPTYT